MRARQIRDECPIKTGLPFKDTRWPTLAIMNYWRKWAAAVGNVPYGIAISPDGSRAYVTNNQDDSVSVIDTSTNTVVASCGGDFPLRRGSKSGWKPHLFC